MIDRVEYMERLIAYRDKPVIKVVTGIRRCGKSTLLALFQEYLRQNGVPGKRIVAVNFEDYANRHLRDPDVLHAHVLEKMRPEGMNYVFLDEIQAVPSFEEVVDSLHLRQNLDIYLTGSNAYLLSGELATLLSGRYIAIEMLPLSFKEYAGFIGTANLEDAYREYLLFSSFPGALDFRGNAKHVADYLQGIYSSVVLKDVISRHRFADVMMLESILRFAFDNVGSPLSSKRISDAMSAGGRRIDTKTVERYLRALTDGFILYQAKRYDVRGKQHLKTLEKYYAVDVRLRTHLLGKAGGDVGHVLENVVYLELLRRGYSVFVGKVDVLEVDFVAMNGDGQAYFQVSASVRDAKTLERELAPLRGIGNHYAKTLLTLDNDPDGDYDGILRANVLRWLME